MTAPVGSYNTNFGRFYSHPKFQRPSALQQTMEPSPEGPYTPRPSITNIIGAINEGFLPGYYAKLVAEYAVDNPGQIQDNIDKFGRDTAVGTLKAVVNRPHPAAAVGDEVHNAIDSLLKGHEPIPFSTTTAQQMFDQFCWFMEQHQPEVIRSEYTVWSYEHGYAGTGDLMWYDQGKICIVDTKTGSSVRPKVALQCAAIANADVILDPSGMEIPIDWESELYVLHVRPRAVKLHKIENKELAWETFLAAKKIFDWNTALQNTHIDLSVCVKTVYKK